MSEKTKNEETKYVNQVVNLVKVFDEALPRHPFNWPGPFPVSIANLSKEEKERIMNEMDRYLQGGELGYTEFRFKLSEKEKEILDKVYHRSMYKTEDGKIYYYSYYKIIGGEKVLFYLRYDERMKTFEMGTSCYPVSQDEEVIKIMREDIRKNIESILKMNPEVVKDLFGRRRG
ncbi:MAG: hypothetical protein QW778_04440 [Candidatus Micrarchaeaceae archaeon]